MIVTPEISRIRQPGVCFPKLLARVEVKQSYAPDATLLRIQMGETLTQNQPPGYLDPHLTTTGKGLWGKQESDL